MADTIRDVLIRATMQIVKTDLKAPDLSDIYKQTAAITKQHQALHAAMLKSAAVEKQRAAAAKLAEEESKTNIKATTVARDEAAASQRELNEMTLRGAEGIKKITDGAFAFARGLALTSLQGDADLEKIVRRLAEVQAKFDLLRGGIDILKGGYEATRDFGDAISKAGSVTALLTGRLAGVKTALTGVVAFLGPAGAIAAGSAAAAAAVATVWKSHADSAEAASKRVREEIRRTQEEAARVQAQKADAALFKAIDAEQQRALLLARSRVSAANVGGSTADRIGAIEGLQSTIDAAIKQGLADVERQRLEAIRTGTLSGERFAQLRADENRLQVGGAEQQSAIGLQLAAERARQAEEQRQSVENALRRREELRRQFSDPVTAGLANFGENFGDPAQQERAQQELAELKRLDSRNLEQELADLAKRQVDRQKSLMKTVEDLATQEVELSRRQDELQRQLDRARTQAQQAKR